MTYLIGVDSGGTHTNIRIITPHGHEQTVPELDKSLAGNRSDDELRTVLAYVVTAVSGLVRSSDVSMWISAAGYAESTRSRFDALVRDAARDVDWRVGIANDAVGLLLAHEPHKIAIVAGTGSVAMARCASGEVIARGGDGWVVADYGAAFWMGLDGIRAAYHALEGGPDTALLRSLVEHYRPLERDAHSDNIAALVREVARRLTELGRDTKPTIASFATQVTRQAELGDDEARRIVAKSVNDLASSAARVYRELALKLPDSVVPPRFLLSGSVASRSPAYNHGLRAFLAELLSDVSANLGRELELTTQLNGLSEAIVLARRLAEDEYIGNIDEHHQYSVL